MHAESVPAMGGSSGRDGTTKAERASLHSAMMTCGPRATHGTGAAGHAYRPPCGSHAAEAASFSSSLGFSVMTASVVRIMPATLSAFSTAMRATLAGSMMPAWSMST
jgi:hypothetical protein